ncbi:hypothetical protein BJ912DRAFT_1145637 [Pholiota molesta]|nr:hypothetical protein BJ912DRAFT_1145637 [Pholiota molesta]
MAKKKSSTPAEEHLLLPAPPSTLPIVDTHTHVASTYEYYRGRYKEGKYTDVYAFLRHSQGFLILPTDRFTPKRPNEHRITPNEKHVQTPTTANANEDANGNTNDSTSDQHERRCGRRRSELPPGGNYDDVRAASLVDVLGATALLSPCAPPLQRGMWAGCLIQGDVGDAPSLQLPQQRTTWQVRIDDAIASQVTRRRAARSGWRRPAQPSSAVQRPRLSDLVCVMQETLTTGAVNTCTAARARRLPFADACAHPFPLSSTPADTSAADTHLPTLVALRCLSWMAACPSGRGADRRRGRPQTVDGSADAVGALWAPNRRASPPGSYDDAASNTALARLPPLVPTKRLRGHRTSNDHHCGCLLLLPSLRLQRRTSAINVFTHPVVV